MNTKLWTLTTLVLLTSCTSQSTDIQSAAKLGCPVSSEKMQDDAERICEAEARALAANSGDFTMNGMTADSRMLDQNSPRTMNISVPIKMSNGDVAAEVLCEINAQHHSVTYVRVTRGPTTKEQADFLRNQGACEE